MGNFLIIVLDGVGAGELPDAAHYGDAGSNTLGNLARAVGGLDLPNLQKLGLGNIIEIEGVKKVEKPEASFGRMGEMSKGKDSTTGHWELGGIKVNYEFSYYPDGFPEELMNTFMDKTGCKGYLGNMAASGTEIIKELGDEHKKTGYPIVYTSADSVFQIAAHEEVIPIEDLYRICKVTREDVLLPPHIVGRVIARPFIGESGKYTRTVRRKDYSLDPSGETILDILSKEGIDTIAVGKINDLFNHRGIIVKEPTKSNSQGVEKIVEYLDKADNSLIFANLVDFDVYFGHRNDPEGFAGALKEFDDALPEILNKLDKDSVLIITSDHGNDPTTPSTDHSREFVPVLYYRKGTSGKDLGVRKTFADVAKTAADYFGVKNELEGESFLH